MKGAITSTGYTSNHIEVNVEIDEPDVIVRPPNHLSRALDIVRSRNYPR